MVADRLIKLWPSIEKIVQYWKKSKQPKSKSYENILEVVDDPFTTTKLTFFSYLAGILEPYLIIVKHEEIEKCKTGPHLKDLDFTNGSLFLDLKNMQMGFEVEENLRKLKIEKSEKSKDTTTYQQISTLKKVAQVFVVTMLNKLFERCPLVSNVIRSAAGFDPTVLVSLPTTIFIK